MRTRRRVLQQNTEEELPQRVVRTLGELLGKGSRTVGTELTNLKNAVLHSLRKEGSHITDDDIREECLDVLQTIRHKRRQSEEGRQK